MTVPLNVLFLEDNIYDVKLAQIELSDAGFELTWQRVESEAAYLAALDPSLDLILSDYHLPQFDGISALHLMFENGFDIPFILVSGLIGEDIAAEAMRRGAADYILKDRMTRLGPAVTRALEAKNTQREKQRALDALRASETELRTIFASMTDFVMVVDKEGRCLKLSPTNFVGHYWPTDNLLGKKMYEFLPEHFHEMILASLAQALASEQPVYMDYSQEIGAEKFWFNISLSRLNSDEILWVARDVTERRQAEEKILELNAQLEQRVAEITLTNQYLVQAKKYAEAASQTKSEFLASMSHELRTPLNAVIGFSEILVDESFGPLNPKQNRYVNNILNSGRHLLGLINDILDLAKVEAGRMQLEISTFDITNALQEVFDVVQSLAIKKQILVTLDMAPALSKISADDAKVKQILYNLLSNAIKFTPEGGRINVHVEQGMSSALGSGTSTNGTVPAQAQGRMEVLRIAVSDTGIGLSLEDQGRIFGAFTQGDSSYARRQEGTGLGLALTKQLVGLHRGTISVQSPGVGQGSTFTVILPVEIEAGSAETRIASALGDPSAPPPTGDWPVILVVEDDPSSRELLAIYLNRASYRVIQAMDGEQAVQMARELQPDAITLDVMLPKKDGWQVLTEIKADPRTASIPVVMVTMTDDRDLGFVLGAVDWLVKPVDQRTLLNVLQKAISSTQNGTISVLVVDDNPQSVELLSDLFSNRGYRVLAATGGQQAIDICLASQPDAIFLDLMMPDVSGFEVVHRLRADPQTQHIPIIVYTAKELTETERQQLNAQVQVITSKASTPVERLLQELQRLIAISSRHRPKIEQL